MVTHSGLALGVDARDTVTPRHCVERIAHELMQGK